MSVDKLLPMRLRIRALQAQLRMRREAIGKCRLRLALEGVELGNRPITFSQWVRRYPLQVGEYNLRDTERNLHVAMNEYQLEKIDVAIKKSRTRA